MAVTASHVKKQVQKLVSRFCTREWEERLDLRVALALEFHMDEEDWSSATDYKNAMAYWVIHHLVLQEQEDTSPTLAAASGPVGSIRTMDESVSFIVPGSQKGATTDDFLRRTTWGHQYLALRNKQPDAHSFVI